MFEILITVALVVFLAAISIPSFQKWRERQRVNTDIQNIISLFADLRAFALADRECQDEQATSWVAQIDGEGTKIFCTTDSIAELEIPEDLKGPIEEYPWTSLMTLDTKTHTGDLSGAVSESDWMAERSEVDEIEWGNPLRVFVFPGSLHARIGALYEPRWARLQVWFDDEIFQTICFSRIANYPFISLSGVCDDY